MNGDFGGRKDWLRFSAGVFAYLAPAFIALCLFLLQIIHTNSMAYLIDSFTSRTGINPDDPFRHVTQHFNQIFWTQTFSSYFGAAAFIVLLISCTLLCFIGALLLQRRRAGAPLPPAVLSLWSFALLAVLPCVLHTYLFRQHAVRHAMAALKYSVPLATIPLVIVPLLLVYLLSMRVGSRRTPPAHSPSPTRVLALSVIMFAVAVGYIYLTLPAMPRLFPPPSPELTALAQSIRQQYTYNDVLFSYHLDIEANPPQMLAFRTNASIASPTRGYPGHHQSNYRAVSCRRAG